MFEVTVKVMGQPAKIVNLESGATILQAKELIGLDGNYTFNVSGQPATADTVLSEGAYVVFSPSVKGAMAVKKPMPKPTKPTTKKPIKKGC
jgi:hypothetical protein